MIEWLNHVATEMHKGFGPLWNPSSSEELKEATRTILGAKFDYLQQRIGDGPYLLGKRFTLPDAYLFVILTGTVIHGIDLSRWPGLVAYVKRVAERPAVQQALQAEGLVK